MSGAIGNGLGLEHLTRKVESPQMYLDASVTRNDIGKPMSISASETVIVAPNGARIYGVLETYEDRLNEGVKAGAVRIVGFAKFTYETGDAVTFGDSVLGSTTAGKVKKGTDAANKVAAIDTTNKTVTVLLG